MARLRSREPDVRLPHVPPPFISRINAFHALRYVSCISTRLSDDPGFFPFFPCAYQPVTAPFKGNLPCTLSPRPLRRILVPSPLVLFLAPCCFLPLSRATSTFFFLICSPPHVSVNQTVFFLLGCFTPLLALVHLYWLLVVHVFGVTLVFVLCAIALPLGLPPFYDPICPSLSSLSRGFPPPPEKFPYPNLIPLSAFIVQGCFYDSVISHPPLETAARGFPVFY